MKHSILELYNVDTGECETVCRSDEPINAPFFKNDVGLCFNSDGLIHCFNLRIMLSHQIHTDPCTHSNNDHLFSPDGRYLAISDEVPGVGSKIWLIDTHGEEKPRLLTPDTVCYLHGYSPDGKTILYTSKRGGKCNIYFLSLNNGRETQLTDAHGHNDGAEYSPCGKYIYFNSTRGGLMDCYRMDSDGKNVTRLTSNGRNNWFPHISPDGKTIVYLSYATDVEPDKHPPDKNVEIRMMNSDGTNDRCILKLFGGQGTMNVNSWKPSGGKFAFVRYDIR
jgi:Tol biopolymer transport system component